MDTTPIVARLSVIADSVNALKELQSLTYDEFAREHVLVGSAERDFQVAIQAALDIGAYLLAELSVQTPTDYKDIFPKLPKWAFYHSILCPGWSVWRNSVTF